MFAVALLTIALLALANARIYERCELARDLVSLGVRREQLATWVCIAFHESRFDTAARNPHSGDHGLFQISELYWCGVGKACGLPCSALRDEDISDDFECALQIHEEHTRLQGNGFLAWVVYPHHCKHNAKKYLADCDSSVKTPYVRTDGSARVLKSRNRNVTAFSYNPKIDELLPPYLTIGSFLRGSYEKEFEQNYDKDKRIDWLNYKIDNIDDLKLPVFNQKVTEEYPTKTISSPNSISTPSPKTTPYLRRTFSPTYTTTSTTILPLPNIKPPSPRRIESNSFRRKKLRPIEESNKFSETTQYVLKSSTLLLTTVAPSNTYKSTTEHTLMQDKSLKSPGTTVVPIPTPRTNTNKYTTNYKLSSTILAQTSAVTKSPLDDFTNLVSTVNQNVSTKTIGRSTVPTPGTNQESVMALRNHSLSIDKTLKSESLADSKRNMPVHKSHADDATSTLRSSSVASFSNTRKFHNIGQNTSHSTTIKPSTKSWHSWKITPSPSINKSTITSTISAPALPSGTTSKSRWSTTPTFKSHIASTTYKPRSISGSVAKSFMHSTSLDETTSPPITSKQSQITWNTAKPWTKITPSQKTTFTSTTEKPPFLSWSATEPLSSTTSSYMTTSTNITPTTSKPSKWSASNSWSRLTSPSRTTFTSSTSKPSSVTSGAWKSWSSTTPSSKTKITSTTLKPRPWSAVSSWSSVAPRPPTTFTSFISKPSSVTWGARKSWTSTTSSYKTKITSTTSRPTSMTLRTANSWSSTKEEISTSAPKSESISSIPWIKNRKQPESTSELNPRTELRSNNTSSTRPFSIASTTNKPIIIPKSTTSAVTSTEMYFPTTSKTTQSIFDLYLNPTKRPNITAFSFPLFKNRGFVFRIFADGTTTHAPNFLRNENHKIAKNETKIRTLK